MADQVLEVEAIPEKGVTGTTVVAEGLIETAIQHTDLLAEGTAPTDAADVASSRQPLSAGTPLVHQDLIVRDVPAGVSGDVFEQAVPTVASVPEDEVATEQRSY